MRSLNKVLENLEDSIRNSKYLKLISPNLRITTMEIDNEKVYTIYNGNNFIISFQLSGNKVEHAGLFDHKFVLDDASSYGVNDLIRTRFIHGNGKSVHTILSGLANHQSPDKMKTDKASKLSDATRTALLRLERDYQKGELDEDEYNKQYDRILRGKSSISRPIKDRVKSNTIFEER